MILKSKILKIHKRDSIEKKNLGYFDCYRYSWNTRQRVFEKQGLFPFFVIRYSARDLHRSGTV